MEFLGLWKKYAQFIKFSIVGASNTLITLILYYVLIKFGVHHMISNTLAYCAGVANSYVWNSSWVFQSKSQSKDKLRKFIIVNLGALILSNTLLYICVDIFGMHKMLSQIIVTGIVMIMNYIGNKLWTFK